MTRWVNYEILVMKKWFLKHKDDIIKTSISGAVVLIFGKFLNFIIELFSQNQNVILDFFKKILQFSIEIPVYSILLFFAVIMLVSKIFNWIKNRNRKLKIIKAIYYTDAHSIDITDELNNAIENDKLKIVLSNEIAGDPHRGVRKKGKIKYKINGQEREKEHQESEVIELP